jgi:signal transduction histidine kinase
MGLGLSICRDILKMYNGVISFESEPDKGSKFFVDIELQNANGEKIEIEEP